MKSRTEKKLSKTKKCKNLLKISVQMLHLLRCYLIEKLSFNKYV